MATITLSFDPVGDEVRESLEAKPETQDAAVLQETMFFMPVRLAIDGVQILDLRENDPTGYLPLPLLGFCVSLNSAVDRIRPGVRVDGYMAGGGELRFLEQGETVKVWCTLNDRPGYATRQELVAAARKFRDDVRNWFLKNAPALRSHKKWTEWFPGPSAYPQ